MNATSFLFLALAVFGASAAPSLLSGCGSLNLGLPAGQLAFAPSASLASVPSSILAVPSLGAELQTGILSAAPACETAIQGPTSFYQTGVIEGSNAIIPGIIPPTSASKSCHCLKTVVRPQIRTEVITVPSVDRLTRIVNNPVVEVVSSNAGGHNRHFEIPTCGQTLSSRQVFAAPSLATSSLSAGQVIASPAFTAPAIAAPAIAAPSFATSSLSAGQVFAAPAEIASPVIGGCF